MAADNVVLSDPPTVVKPGHCPRKLQVAPSKRACVCDEDCPGDDKCCVFACGAVCVPPAFSKETPNKIGGVVECGILRVSSKGGHVQYTLRSSCCMLFASKPLILYCVSVTVPGCFSEARCLSTETARSRDVCRVLF